MVLEMIHAAAFGLVVYFSVRLIRVCLRTLYSADVRAWTFRSFFGIWLVLLFWCLGIPEITEANFIAFGLSYTLAHWLVTRMAASIEEMPYPPPT